jgi:hypothetical protein
MWKEVPRHPRCHWVLATANFQLQQQLLHWMWKVEIDPPGSFLMDLRLVVGQ